MSPPRFGCPGCDAVEHVCYECCDTGAYEFGDQEIECVCARRERLEYAAELAT